jgi:hypothetical protein
MHAQIMKDFMSLPHGTQNRIQQEINVPFQRGNKESDASFAKRFLHEVDNAGKIRLLETLVNE